MHAWLSLSFSPLLETIGTMFRLDYVPVVQESVASDCQCPADAELHKQKHPDQQIIEYEMISVVVSIMPEAETPLLNQCF